MRCKLVVSDDIQFDVRFALNDNGTEAEFGFRAAAKRVKQTDLEGLTLGEFLRDRAQVRMQSWLPDTTPPLVDEDRGLPVESGPQALEALYDLVPSMPGVVFAAFLAANGAKGKAGNSGG